jgi:hypothetical protein
MQELQADKNGATYLFSGITRWQDKLICGFNDIKTHDIAVTELCEEIGEFELLIHTEGRIELGTDFFGMCQWYYYKSEDGIFVTATSYHLLLLILKKLNIRLRLNSKKIAAKVALPRKWTYKVVINYFPIKKY